MTLETSLAPSPLRRVFASRGLMGGCYVAAVVFTATAVFLGTSPTLTGPLGPASPVVLTLLALGLLAIAAPAAGLGWRMFGLLSAQSRDAGLCWRPP